MYMLLQIKFYVLKGVSGVSVECIADSLIKNPKQIKAWQKKEWELKKNPEAFLRHLEYFTEDFVFSPEENIMVYADFPCESFYPAINEPEEFRKIVPHRHEFFEMFYIYRGEFDCYYEGEIYPLKSGSLWVFNAQCAHRLSPKTPDAFIFNILVRKSSFLNTVFPLVRENDLFMNFFLNSVSGAENMPCHMNFNISEDDNIKKYLFDIICEYYSKMPYSQSKIKLLYASLLIEISRKYKQTFAEINDKDYRIARIISYISDHMKDVTLSSLAKYFHTSPGNLSKQILRHTGLSFSEYLCRFKLEKAKYLLDETSLTIDEISAEVGYSQRSSFDKEFKKMTGVTPKQYRAKKE